MQYYEEQLGPTNQKALLWFLLRAIKSMWWEHSWKKSCKNLSDPTQYVKGALGAIADSASSPLGWNCRWRKAYSTAHTVLKMSAVSRFFLVCSVFHLGLTNCYSCCGSLRGRLIGSREQRFQQLPHCLSLSRWNLLMWMPEKQAVLPLFL